MSRNLTVRLKLAFKITSCVYEELEIYIHRTYSATIRLNGPIFLETAFFLPSLVSREHEVWDEPSSCTSLTSTLPYLNSGPYTCT